jgi:hypothetical protein
MTAPSVVVPREIELISEESKSNFKSQAHQIFAASNLTSVKSDLLKIGRTTLGKFDTSLV